MKVLNHNIDVNDIVVRRFSIIIYNSLFLFWRQFTLKSEAISITKKVSLKFSAIRATHMFEHEYSLSTMFA